MNNNAINYLRFSSQSQDSQTIEVQRKKCMEYAINNGLNVLREYVDEAKSGRNGDRDGLQELLKDAKSGLFQYVIVYNLDRYFRDAAEGMQTEKELKKLNVTILSTSEPFIDNASGRLSRNMNLVIAQYYSDLYSEKITNGIANNASKFLSTGGQIPFGYKSVDKVLCIDEEKAPYVKIIYEKYLDGESIIDIADYLNKLGIKTNKNNKKINKNGGKFNKNSLRTILTSKKYIGTYVFKGEETPNAMPRIIDDELFNKVQEKMARNHKAPACNKAKEPYLLTGKAFCSYCNDMLFGGGGGYNRNKVYYQYYTCKTKQNEKTCNKKNILKDKLEDIVVSESRKLINNKVMENIIKDTVLVCEQDRDTSIISKLNRTIKDSLKKKDNLINAIASCDNISLQQDLFRKITDIDNQVIEINKEIQKEERNHVKATVQHVGYFVHRLKNGNTNELSYRKRLISTLVNKVFVFDDYVRIYFNISDMPVDVDLSTINKGKCSNKDLCSPPVVI
jgi:Site-specific recombinases, DNA invertase Pin homologs